MELSSLYATRLRIHFARWRTTGLYAAAQTPCRADNKLRTSLLPGRVSGQAVTEMFYHLELLMNRRNLIIAAFVGITLIGCASTRTQESTGEYIDDTTITTKVKSKLLLAKDTTGTAISVETFKGIVQLSGFVKSDQERQRAGEIAKSVAGVRRVENKISIRGS
jgi:hyperosmotically inducible periplasmic protein